MKKIFLLFAATIFSAGVVSAQDINEAISLANDGKAAFEAGLYDEAIQAFQKAITIADGLGEAGAEHANTCKTAVGTIYLSHAKNLLKSGEYDAALVKLNETISAAETYGLESTVADAQKLIPNVYTALGNKALKAKNLPEAIAAYNKVVELDPTNGDAYIRLGKALAASGKVDDAIAAYETAAANGEEKDANKQLSTLYARMALASKKAQKWQEVLNYAEKSLAYLETANALSFAGEASSQLGKHTQTIEYFEKYLAVSPNAKNANQVKYVIADAAQKAGLKEKAIEYYSMITSDPDYAEYAKHQITELSK